MEVIAANRKARFNYQILDTYETGIVLKGTEIKSIKANRISLNEAYVIEKQNELLLINSHIPEYEQGNRFNHNPTRPRKLLAHKSEISKMAIAVSRNGLALVPLKMYAKGRWVKLEVGVCRGKAKKDKREDNAKRQAKMEMAKAMKLTSR